MPTEQKNYTNKNSFTLGPNRTRETVYQYTDNNQQGGETVSENIIDEVFTEAEAAAYWKIKPQSLAKFRMNRIGPVFFRIGQKRGAIRYSKSDLDKYARENSGRSHV